MKISYNWLKEYLDIDLPATEVAELLTDTGLEVEGLEEHQSVKGGLEGLVIGEVKTKEKHPDADRLSITKVDVGTGELLDIVCGAPNVDTGQKVVVATVGATIYPTEGEPFTIKKAKIRGQASQGMICAEDEIGLGTSHDGIMVLENGARVGMLAKDYFKIGSDYTFEIGLTPNRTDAMSHYGVARDLLATLKTNRKGYENVELKKPDVSAFKTENTDLVIPVEVQDSEACPRYAGVTINGVTVKESPDWLKNSLTTIGQKPINNVVDITNYILHGLGQPLHAFDTAQIKGGKVIVRKMDEGTTFITLDEEERKLDANDLMICNAEDGMCIAGVFGGIHSGVTEQTTAVFLESAYFDPVHVRKTAKRHTLNTDASFRFERGIDPDQTVFALKAAALLIKEVAGGTISSEVIDIYPKSIPAHEIEVGYAAVNRLIGKNIPAEKVKSILAALEIEILSDGSNGLKVSVPAYRHDVTREADIIEEILRIYGYNNVEFTSKISSSISYSQKPDKENLRNLVSDHLSANGFAEIMSNSLTKGAYYENQEESVEILNPLSSDLGVLRQSLLFNGLEAIAHNINRKQANLKLYEFGYTYHLKGGEGRDKYLEFPHFAVFVTGQRHAESWKVKEENVDFFTLKGAVDAILNRLGLNDTKTSELEGSTELQYGLSINKNGKEIVQLGSITKKQLKKLDIEQEVFYADLNWGNILKLVGEPIKYKEIPVFPEVRRDLALLLDKNIKYTEIEQLAHQTERKLLKAVNLFDVYEGKNLPDGKKSYAVSFTLLDEEKTLTDKEINKTMDRLINAYKAKLQAEIR